MIFTIGHSSRPSAEFISLLKKFEIRTLADVRSVPQSRYNPQFGLLNLSATLNENDITYLPMKSLGGKREPRPDSENTAFRSDGFRGYADYMQTGEFAAAINSLIYISAQSRTAIMCAEADPMRCHRALVSDALLARGMQVRHILGAGKFLVHALSEFAKTEDGVVTYPAQESAQRSLF
ncbi:MAG: hypothetical protein JWO78_1891 [Micavibrio sp.]|nr:hypothetical protein [Micavibrio sp.]